MASKVKRNDESKLAMEATSAGPEGDAKILSTSTADDTKIGASGVVNSGDNHGNEISQKSANNLGGGDTANGHKEEGGVGTIRGRFVELEQFGAAPLSAPPFGTFPISPFAFNIPPTSMATGIATPVASAADLVSSGAAMALSHGYYLIPATSVAQNQAGIAFISPTAAATVLPQAPISPLASPHHYQQQQRLHMPVSASLSLPFVGNGVNPSVSPPMQHHGSSQFPKGAVTKTSGKYSRPTKVPGKSQFRDELIIRNADSGKIMGVKGRRVAIIEEISKTIISFQKVPQGAKERTLTITGPSEEAIEQAKGLVEDTIRRNVSPARAEGEGEAGDFYRRASIISTCLEEDNDWHSNDENADGGSADGSEEGKEHANNGGRRKSELTIEAGQLGEMLKLQCNDPALLEAAQKALSAYFSGQKQPHGHQSLRRTSTDAFQDGNRKGERRKSMPVLDNKHRLLSLKHSIPPGSHETLHEVGTEDLQSPTEETTGQTESPGEDGKSIVNKRLTLTMMISPPIGKQKASIEARSTPNLAATGLNKRALSMMKSAETNSNAGGDKGRDVERKFMADESGGGTLVVHEKKNRVMVRVVYTREFVLQCSASPFTAMTPAGLPWMVRETPEILRQVPGKFDINGYKQTCMELRQQMHQ